MSETVNHDEDEISHAATHALASLALTKAIAAEAKVEAHEELCAERYDHIRTSIQGVKDTVSSILKVIGWGGSILATVLIGLIAFFGARALSTNDAEVNRLRAEVEVLSAQRQGLQGVQGIQGQRGLQGERGDDLTLSPGLGHSVH